MPFSGAAQITEGGSTSRAHQLEFHFLAQDTSTPSIFIPILEPTYVPPPGGLQVDARPCHTSSGKVAAPGGGW